MSNVWKSKIARAVHPFHTNPVNRGRYLLHKHEIISHYLARPLEKITLLFPATWFCVYLTWTEFSPRRDDENSFAAMTIIVNLNLNGNAMLGFVNNYNSNARPYHIKIVKSYCSIEETRCLLRGWIDRTTNRISAWETRKNLLGDSVNVKYHTVTRLF